MTTFSDLILVFINFFKSGLEDLIFLIGLDWLIGSIFLHLINNFFQIQIYIFELFYIFLTLKLVLTFHFQLKIFH